jgi:hypothetical protein
MLKILIVSAHEMHYHTAHYDGTHTLGLTPLYLVVVHLFLRTFAKTVLAARLSFEKLLLYNFCIILIFFLINY